MSNSPGPGVMEVTVVTPPLTDGGGAWLWRIITDGEMCCEWFCFDEILTC